jgi:DNA-binding LytR/AlgR family response regulator
MRLRVVIADDEPLSLRRLEIGLSRLAEVEIVGRAADGESARAAIRQAAPDLVVLDIRMPGLSGIELAEEIGEDGPAVIFVTAYGRHALKAFELAAVDYVLKPLDFDRLAEAVERARRSLAARRPVPAAPEPETEPEPYQQEIWVADRRGRTRVSVEAVEWFEAERDYVRIHAPERSYLIRRSITDLAERLDPRLFLRLHRSALVNTRRIAALKRRAGGGLTAVLVSGVEVPVGRTFQPLLRARLSA